MYNIIESTAKNNIGIFEPTYLRGPPTLLRGIYLWKPFQRYNPQPIYHLESEKKVMRESASQVSLQLFFKWLHLNIQHIFYFKMDPEYRSSRWSSGILK